MAHLERMPALHFPRDLPTPADDRVVPVETNDRLRNPNEPELAHRFQEPSRETLMYKTSAGSNGNEVCVWVGSVELDPSNH